MPSTSKKQHNFMAAIAHSPSFAKKAGVPQSVGEEFNNADKGKTFKQGGDMKKGYADGGMAMVNKGGKMVPSFAADGEGKMANGGMTKKMANGGMTKKMATGGATKKMADGGMTSMGAVKTASPSRDGIAQQGKTKGTIIAMKRGGKC